MSENDTNLDPRMVERMVAQLRQSADALEASVANVRWKQPVVLRPKTDTSGGLWYVTWAHCRYVRDGRVLIEKTLHADTLMVSFPRTRFEEVEVPKGWVHCIFQQKHNRAAGVGHEFADCPWSGVPDPKPGMERCVEDDTHNWDSDHLLIECPTLSGKEVELVRQAVKRAMGRD